MNHSLESLSWLYRVGEYLALQHVHTSEKQQRSAVWLERLLVGKRREENVLSLSRFMYRRNIFETDSSSSRLRISRRVKSLLRVVVTRSEFWVSANSSSTFVCLEWSHRRWLGFGVWSQATCAERKRTPKLTAPRVTIARSREECCFVLWYFKFSFALLREKIVAFKNKLDTVSYVRKSVDFHAASLRKF